MFSLAKLNLSLKPFNILLLIWVQACVTGCTYSGAGPNPQPTPQILPKQAALIQEVKTKPFLQKILKPSIKSTNLIFRGDMVNWHFPDAKEEPHVTAISVFKSEKEAENAAKTYFQYASGVFKYDRQNIADYFLYKISKDPFKQQNNASRKSEEPTHGVVIFRRKNVVISYPWKGDTASAATFAKKIDGILLHDNAICPKGMKVSIPNIDISVPDKVPLHRTVKISYRVQDGHKVLASTKDSSTKTWKSQGVVSYWAKNMGKQQIELNFATPNNVIFTKTVTINVVTKQEYLDGLKQRP